MTKMLEYLLIAMFSAIVLLAGIAFLVPEFGAYLKSIWTAVKAKGSSIMGTNITITMNEITDTISNTFLG